MKAIRKQRDIYAVLSVICILLTVWFAIRDVAEAALIFAAASAVMIVLLFRQNSCLQAARLIWDNRILNIPGAVLLKPGDRAQADVELTVVSTFGILIGNRVYKWGCDGITGTRLTDIEIDRERIYLTFGDEGNMHRVELLHGLTNAGAVSEVKDNLWKETGVKAAVKGWQP